MTDDKKAARLASVMALATLMGGLSGGAPVAPPPGRRTLRPVRRGKCERCGYPLGGATCKKIHETDPRNKP